MDAVCGLCGKPRRADALVCPHCFSEYTGEATRSLRSGKEITVLDWAEQKANETLPRLREEFSVKKGVFEDLRKPVNDETREQLGRMLSGQRVPRTQYEELWKGVHDKLWTERGGNKIFAEWKQAEKDLAPRISALEGLLDRIRQERQTSEIIERALSAMDDTQT